MAVKESRGLNSNYWTTKNLISFYQKLLDKGGILPNGVSANRLQMLKDKVANKYKYAKYKKAV
tara:strand:- start:492 stop:680 length:189 start_codon:yes stop_codon:yes gene_type:complete